MRNDPLNPIFDVSGLVHVCMYARACVRMCARVRVCEAVCLWLFMVPRYLIPASFPSSYSSSPQTPHSSSQGLQHSIFKVSSTPKRPQTPVFFGNR